MRQRAAHAAARGNDVRAAILQTRAARLATPARAGEAREAARESIVALSRRLQAALKWDEATRQRWAAALDPLRDFARQGFRSSAARALYDLQRVCIDFERPLYEINLIEWLLSFGRRSIKRPLPHQRQVRNVKHLRRALDRLARVPLPDSDRTALMELLQAELDRARLALRSAVLPLVARAVDRSDLRPRNLPEEVARRAIDEELVERIESSGYLAIGDVRDAIARNDLKLDDLTPREFVHGDALLCADRRLAVALGGIYRRAESYLRGLQKASSLAFGTAAGRVLTLWLVIPFGAALATLVTAEHLVEMAQEFLLPARAVALEEARWSAATAGADAVAVESVREHFMKGMMVHEIAPQWVTPGGIAILGLAILGLMHWPAFRAAVVRCLRGVGWGMRAVLWDLPRWAARWPALRRLFESHWFRFFGLWLLFPASVALLAMALPWLLGAPSAVTAGVGLGGFLCGALLANTPAGQRLLDEASDLSALGWRYVRIDLLPGLYQAIMGFFHTLLERIDRLLYVVDEWLRFRAGESRWSIGVKAVAGLVWSVVVYLVRMFVNLLAEPQINPIKHFPTVTVAHKMTAPFLLFMLPAALQAPPLGMSAVNANLVAFFAQLLLPGVFGFLVWELKENWRLYAANRPKALPAAIVGGHGETMRQLLRPGFHSGTLPRLFARLRRVDPTTRRRVRQGSSHQQLSALHHTEAAVAAFAWRQLIAVIEASQMLPGVRLRVGHVHLSTNQILIPLVRDEDPSDPLTISLEERAGWLLVTLHEAPGWLDVLSSPARAALGNAVAGFYQRCGAELVSEQVRAALAPSGAEFEVTARGLRAWLPGQVQSTVLFDLRDGNAISEAREVLGLPPTPQSPVLTVQRMLLKQNPIQWTRWVEVWDRARAGEPVPALAPFLFRRRSVAAADQRPRKIAAPAE